jgi:hypothetical protein
MIPAFDSADELPQSLGDLQFAGISENDDPRLGFQARYERGASKADVYLYDFGLFPLPDESRNVPLFDHFKICIGDILQLAQNGYYKNFILGPLDALVVDADEISRVFYHGQFEFLSDDSDQTIDIGLQRSHLLLTTHRGFFSKVRFSYPASDRDARIDDLYGLTCDWLRSVHNAPP